MKKQLKYRRLRKALIDDGRTYGDLARLIGLKPPDFSKRLAGTVAWTDAEKSALAKILGLKSVAYIFKE